MTTLARKSTVVHPILVLVPSMLFALAGCADAGHPGTPDIEGNLENTPGGNGPNGSTPGSNGSTPGSTPGTPGTPSGAKEAKCTEATQRYGALGMMECVPSGMEGKASTPAGLVVALHGYTQGIVQTNSPGQKWGFKPTTEWSVLAEKHKFYVIFADKGTSAFQWYAFFGTSGIGRSDLEPSSIAQMVKDMQAKHNIDPNKIFVNGLSAGAYMSTVMLATYPDVFSAGAMFEGGAYGCSTSCAALGKKGQGWTWPGNHAAALVKQGYPNIWNNAAARKPRLLVFQGDADGAVTPENLADVTQQWLGALGIAGGGTKSTLKGHEYTEWEQNGHVMLATLLMKGIGHGTPVDPGSGPDQGGWDPQPSKTMSSDSNATQDWTNTAGIYGPYYAAKFFGLIQ
jgi:poly(hydroxyalkanoate) depolymerase family esterase